MVLIAAVDDSGNVVPLLTDASRRLQVLMEPANDTDTKVIVQAVHPTRWDVSADYAAAQTNTSVKAAPSPGLSLYITDILISNGATAGNITLLDGSGGSVKCEGYFAVDGKCVLNLKTPIKLTANTALCITSTDVTTHSITICGFID